MPGGHEVLESFKSTGDRHQEQQQQDEVLGVTKREHSPERGECREPL